MNNNCRRVTRPPMLPCERLSQRAVRVVIVRLTNLRKLASRNSLPWSLWSRPCGLCELQRKSGPGDAASEWCIDCIAAPPAKPTHGHHADNVARDALVSMEPGAVRCNHCRRLRGHESQRSTGICACTCLQILAVLCLPGSAQSVGAFSCNATMLWQSAGSSSGLPSRQAPNAKRCH